MNAVPTVLELQQTSHFILVNFARQTNGPNESCANAQRTCDVVMDWILLVADT